MCSLIPASWRLLIELSSLFTQRERRSAVHEVKILSRDQTSKKDKVNTSQLTHWREMKWYRGFRYLRCTTKYILCSLWLPLV